ncbi:hypothetical protein JCM8097_008222 [Rhodosporidiobolus ruineniae]
MRSFLPLFLAAAAGLVAPEAVSANSLPARHVALQAKHQAIARDMSSNRIEKRYPPDWDGTATYTPTTTPAYLASQTPSSTSSTAAAGATTTPAPSGAYDPANQPSRALVAATTSSATTCAPAYVAPTVISGTGTLPKPTSFVRKQAARSSQLVGDGNLPYRIVGPNMYWLCQDENYGPIGSYTDKGRVREAMAIAVAMGANTIRVLSCGISVGTNVGNVYNFEPTYGTFNDAAMDIRDYVLYAAREYGLRVIMTMTDNYDYYHGGKYQFLDFRRASRDNKGAAFYSNRAVINAYNNYVYRFLTRVNTYTGVEYRNDPTILAWETGNELGGYINAEQWPTNYWITSVIAAIAKYDQNHLIIDGTNGFWNYSTNAISDGLKNRGVDIVTDHGYPRNLGILNKEIALAQTYFKGFFIGEYDWTSTNSATSLDSYLAAIEGAGTFLGDMIWNVMAHDSECCAFVSHNDGYSAYYPNGNSAADQVNLLKVVQHWYKVTGRTQPTQLPAVACPQPVF